MNEPGDAPDDLAGLGNELMQQALADALGEWFQTYAGELVPITESPLPIDLSILIMFRPDNPTPEVRVRCGVPEDL